MTILHYYPNMAPDIIDALVDRGYEGIVIAATGLATSTASSTRRWSARDAGVQIYMTLQTLWGFHARGGSAAAGSEDPQVEDVAEVPPR